MRSQEYSSTSWRAPVTQSYFSTKLRAIRNAKSSTAPTPPRRARAYTVFFWVSVAITALLSPVAWVAAVKSPNNWLVTFTSLILCTGVDRSMCTRRTSALPYWLAPKTMAMHTSSVASLPVECDFANLIRPTRCCGRAAPLETGT